MIYPGFDIAHLYDQSLGHTKIRPDGSVNNMNVAPGGTVLSMRSNTMSELSKFTTNMSIENKQYMDLIEDNSGPFWFSDDIKLSTKYNTQIGPKIIQWIIDKSPAMGWLW